MWLHFFRRKHDTEKIDPLLKLQRICKYWHLFPVLEPVTGHQSWSNSKHHKQIWFMNEVSKFYWSLYSYFLALCLFQDWQPTAAPAADHPDADTQDGALVEDSQVDDPPFEFELNKIFEDMEKELPEIPLPPVPAPQIPSPPKNKSLAVEASPAPAPAPSGKGDQLPLPTPCRSVVPTPQLTQTSSVGVAQSNGCEDCIPWKPESYHLDTFGSFGGVSTCWSWQLDRLYKVF